MLYRGVRRCRPSGSCAGNIPIPKQPFEKYQGNLPRQELTVPKNISRRFNLASHAQLRMAKISALYAVGETKLLSQRIPLIDIAFFQMACAFILRITITTFPLISRCLFLEI